MHGIEKLDVLPFPEVSFWDRCDQSWWSIYDMCRETGDVDQVEFWYELCSASSYMLNVLELG